jgi:hypothetical protein
LKSFLIQVFKKSCPYCKDDTTFNKIDICDWCMKDMIAQQILLVKKQVEVK